MRLRQRKEPVRRASEKSEILGLVLAGGRSVRMGTDKGTLSYADSGVPQVRLAYALLEEICGRAFVSINAEQLKDPVYESLATIVDTAADRGPAAGLAAAFEYSPESAWLVLAVDMPLVSSGVLRNLVTQRDPARIATVHRHADGTIEPLCAIWEAHAREAVAVELTSGRGSLRRVAAAHDAAVAALPEPERLISANTPAQRDAISARLTRAGSQPGRPKS